MDLHLWAAQTAFGAYRSSVGSISPVTERSIPDWEQLPDRVRAGWVEAAKAILIFAESIGTRVNPDSREAPVVEKQRETPFLYG